MVSNVYSVTFYFNISYCPMPFQYVIHHVYLLQQKGTNQIHFIYLVDFKECVET